jgi:hypothetical protein
MYRFKRLARILLALALTILGIVVSTPVAKAEQAYPIAFTEIGIYPRIGPNMDTAHNGNALSDGTMVTLECEVEGQVVSSSVSTSSVWAKTPYGYLPNAYLHTGVDGWTPGVPRCEQLAEPAGPKVEMEEPIDFSGTRIADNHLMSVILHTHFFAGGGQPAIIDWAFFARHPRFVAWIKNLPVKGAPQVYSAYSVDPREVQMMLSLGSFTVKRYSDNCFFVHDYYDFEWMYVVHNATTAIGVGKEFHVYSSGCI